MPLFSTHNLLHLDTSSFTQNFRTPRRRRTSSQLNPTETRPNNARLLPFWPAPRLPPLPAHRNLPQPSPPTARRRKHDLCSPKRPVRQYLRLCPYIEVVDPPPPPPRKKS